MEAGCLERMTFDGDVKQKTDDGEAFRNNSSQVWQRSGAAQIHCGGRALGQGGDVGRALPRCLCARSWKIADEPVQIIIITYSLCH